MRSRLVLKIQIVMQSKLSNLSIAFFWFVLLLLALVRTHEALFSSFDPTLPRFYFLSFTSTPALIDTLSLSLHRWKRWSSKHLISRNLKTNWTRTVTSPAIRRPPKKPLRNVNRISMHSICSNLSEESVSSRTSKAHRRQRTRRISRHHRYRRTNRKRRSVAPI